MTIKFSRPSLTYSWRDRGFTSRYNVFFMYNLYFCFIYVN